MATVRVPKNREVLALEHLERAKAWLEDPENETEDELVRMTVARAELREALALV